MWCHLLFFLPILGLGVFWLLPWQAAWPTYLVILAGSAALFVTLVRAIRQPVLTGIEGLEGERGETVSGLDPEGLIRLRGELWQAEAAEPIPAGARVRVVAVRGVKLTVTREG